MRPSNTTDTGPALSTLDRSLLTRITHAVHDARVSRSRSWFLIFAAGVLMAGVASAQDRCAKPVSDGAEPTIADCLHILRASIGSVTCDDCLCDANGSGGVGITDALRCLRVVLGFDLPLECPACGGSTTTLPACASCGEVLSGAAKKDDLCELDDVFYRDLFACLCLCCDQFFCPVKIPERDYTCTNATASTLLRCYKEGCRGELTICYER